VGIISFMESSELVDKGHWSPCIGSARSSKHVLQLV
jgi:hypothetical protein